MSIRVNIPVRVRVDRHSLEARLEDLEQAVAAAAERAMVSSVDVVLAPRGGYLRSCVEVPTFTWGGPDLAGVPGALQRRVEDLVAGALHRAARRAGVTDWGTDADEVPEVSPPDPSEKFDRTRYDWRTGLYEIPTYGPPKAKKRQVPLQKKTPPAKPKARDTVAFTPYAGYDEQFRDDLYGAAWDRWGMDMAAWPKVFCALYLMNGVEGFALNVYQVQNGRLRSRAYLPFIASQVLSDDPKRPGVFSVLKTYDFAFESGGGPSSVGLTNFRQSAEEHYFQRRAPKEKGVAGDAEERKAALRSEAHDKVMQHTAGWETSIAAFWTFQVAGEFRFRLALHAATAATFDPYKGSPLPVLNLGGQKIVVAKVDKDGDELQEPASLAPDAGGGQGDGIGLDDGYGPNAGVIIAPKYSETPYASLYPGSGFLGARTITTECKPWGGEPSTEDLPDAELLRALIQQIAKRLEILPCPYAVNFAINAARVIGERAEQVTNYAIGDEEGFMAPLSRVARDKKGKYYFEPIHTVSIQHLRRLAGTIPLLRKLLGEISRVLAPSPEREARRFNQEVREAVSGPALVSVQNLFLYACQISLIQFLNSTKKNIEERLKSIDNYVKTFQILLSSVLTDLAELMLLKDSLERFHGLVGEKKGEAALAEARWQLQIRGVLSDPLGVNEKTRRELAVLASQPEAKDLMLRLADPDFWVQRRGVEAGNVGAGMIFERAGDGAWVIRDSHGVDWTLDQLKRAVTTRTEYAEQMDPLVSQVVNQGSGLAGLAKKAHDFKWVDSFVRRLLDKMHDQNRIVKGETVYAHTYAFSHGQISEDYQNPTVYGTRYNLRGVHKFAHQAIGECFEGDDYYHLGLSALLDSERAGSIWDLIVTIDGIAMSILCPPLGAAIFIGQGIYEGLESLHHAEEQAEIYGALLNPEQVLSRMAIEIDIFSAKLGIALSILGGIPEAKAGVEAAITGVKTAVRKGVTEGVKEGFSTLGRTIIEDSLKSIAMAMKKGIAMTLAEQLAVQEVMNEVIGHFVNDLVEIRIAELEAQAKSEGWFQE